MYFQWSNIYLLSVRAITSQKESDPPILLKLPKSYLILDLTLTQHLWIDCFPVSSCARVVHAIVLTLTLTANTGKPASPGLLMKIFLSYQEHILLFQRLFILLTLEADRKLATNHFHSECIQDGVFPHCLNEMYEKSVASKPLHILP